VTKVHENFDKSLELTLDKSIEGGFSNRLADRGGPTNEGITLLTLRHFFKDFDYGDFDGDGDIDINDILLLDTPDKASPVYRVWFWEPSKCDDLPSGVDYIVFDSAVNHGPKNAGIFLQRAINWQELNIKVDGCIGPATVHAANLCRRQSLVSRLLSERDIFYRKIIASDPAQEANFRGWMNRLAKVAANVKQFN
jgi:lysozyme family protein